MLGRKDAATDTHSTTGRIEDRKEDTAVEGVALALRVSGSQPRRRELLQLVPGTQHHSDESVPLPAAEPDLVLLD
jgi:hypothetical protein